MEALPPIETNDFVFWIEKEEDIPERMPPEVNVAAARHGFGDVSVFHGIFGWQSAFA